MGSSYKADVLTQIIATGLERLPRGAAQQLAAAADVTPQTVTKWRKGEVQPEQFRWPVIEEFFGLEAGEIARQVLPIVGEDTTVELVLRLSDQVGQLEARLAAVEAALAARHN